MKKTLIAVIILIFLAAASTTAFLIVKSREDKKAAEVSEQTEDYTLFSFNSDSVNQVTFDCPDGKYTAELSDGKWQLSGSDEFILSNSYVQNVCTYMSDLTAEKDYGEVNEENKAAYGLDDPTVITASDGSAEYTVYVGDPDPTGSYYYIMISDRNKIYAIDTLYGCVLKTSRLMMKDTYMLPYSDSEIEHIQLIRDGETVYDLTHNDEDDTWQLAEEYSELTVDKTDITSMINVMTRIEVQEFLDENLEDYSKYGFDNPTAELLVTGNDGKTVRLLFSYYGNDTLTYTYVLFESGQAAKFYTGDVDFIEYTPANFLVQEVCNVSIYSIEGFDLTFNGVSDSFDVDMNENCVSMNGISVSDLGDKATAAFTNLYNSLVYIALREVDISAVPEKSEPVLSVNYRLSDGTDKLFELYWKDDNSCYAFVNDSYTGAIVSMDELDGKNSVSEFYEKLTEIISAS